MRGRAPLLPVRRGAKLNSREFDTQEAAHDAPDVAAARTLSSCHLLVRMFTRHGADS